MLQHRHPRLDMFLSGLEFWEIQMGMSTVVLYCWCHSDSASVLLYFTSLSPPPPDVLIESINISTEKMRDLIISVSSRRAHSTCI